MEQALRDQLIDSIPYEYLDSFRNVDSDMINDSIPDIITFFIINYCQLIDQELSDKKDELKSTVFNPEEPVDIIFNKIKTVAVLCSMTNNAMTNRLFLHFIFIQTEA